MPFTISGKKFATKQAVEGHIREMFWRYPAMGALTGEDREFVLALIDMHPSRLVIVDCGIRSIHIQPVPLHEKDQRRFLVKRIDDSLRDFSWRNSLSPKSAERKLAGILRYLIKPQIQDFKKRTFRGRCENETCKSPLSPENCEVDHADPTFKQLMDGWLRTVRLSPDDIAIVRRTEYQANSYLEDPVLAQAWVDYHEINARLRCVCKPCNSSVLRRLHQKA
jgi:hypothetical protein